MKILPMLSARPIRPKMSISAAHSDTNWDIALSSYAAAPATSLPSGKSLRRTSGSVLEQVKEECYSQGGVRR